ncbi:unnamed protein product [Phytophthora fragariaefolia]|uniref:Unnamed protein product n=1 Tax=Phytophthora fragariaefolia TaxID=1490495 RepID=A0A9W6UDL9_9STRA|nr:unnamed protein product [Phytophthora fragariaefolia]
MWLQNRNTVSGEAALQKQKASWQWSKNREKSIKKPNKIGPKSCYISRLLLAGRICHWTVCCCCSRPRPSPSCSSQGQVAQAKLWKTEITDQALTTNAACSVLRLTSNRCCSVCYQAGMGRAKRKWTCESIEEALRQNAHVNATPAELEETTDKRKRQRRRANKKRNLLKELEALSVAGTEAVGPLAGPVMQVQPILPAQPTLEQEGKQEEDDPADHQRQFAAAYAEGQRQFVSEASPPVTTNPPSVDRGAAKRARNTERQRIRKANMTLSQKEREKVKATAHRRASRALMSASKRNAVMAADRSRQEKRRSEQNQVGRVGELDQNRRLQRARREAQTEEEHNYKQARNTQSQIARRLEQTEDERGAVRATDRARHSERRAQHTEDQQDAQREHNRARRKAPKRCQGHVNHEDFQASMVTGKDVVEGAIGYLPLLCACCAKLQNGLLNLTSSAVSRAGRQSRPKCGGTTWRLHVSHSGGNGAFHGLDGALRLSPYRRESATQVRTDIHCGPRYARACESAKRYFADLDIIALQDIENMMVECNPFAQQFLSSGQKLREDLARVMQVKDIRYVLHSKPSEPRTYNLPTVSEVGVAMVEDGNLTRPRDLYVVAKEHSLLWLFETDEKYDPLQYTLLFPYGDLGWTYTDVYANGAKYRNKRKMSLREHVVYRLFQKVDDQTALQQGGRLFQQWVVDQRAKCGHEQLRLVAKNQKKLRAELYHGISDALLNEKKITLDEGEVLVSEYDRATGTLVHPDRGSGFEHFLNQVGKRIVLPDSHSGSPRNMYKHYQESMAIVREYGKPDAFITMTCNPKWVEIIVLLPDEQTAQDRPDIVARV